MSGSRRERRRCREQYDIESGEPPLDCAEQEQSYSGEDDRDLKSQIYPRGEEIGCEWYETTEEIGIRNGCRTDGSSLGFGSLQT